MLILKKGNYKLCSKIIDFGLNIDYVNKFGKTALHYFVEQKLEKQILYLLFKNSNPHILDLDELDACDKAKRNGLGMKIMQFNNCTYNKKIIPLLPDGTYPQFKFKDVYQYQ